MFNVWDYSYGTLFLLIGIFNRVHKVVPFTLTLAAPVYAVIFRQSPSVLDKYTITKDLPTPPLPCTSSNNWSLAFLEVFL